MIMHPPETAKAIDYALEEYIDGISKWMGFSV